MRGRIALWRVCRRLSAGMVLLSCLSAVALANEAALAQEAREAALAGQLRCVVCQNQTVAESQAPMAADMRREIRTQLAEGRSDDEVIDFF